MKCPQCGNDDAAYLLNSTLCVNKKCKNYDEKWALEQGYLDLVDEGLQDLNSLQNIF